VAVIGKGEESSGKKATAVTWSREAGKRRDRRPAV